MLFGVFRLGFLPSFLDFSPAYADPFEHEGVRAFAKCLQTSASSRPLVGRAKAHDSDQIFCEFNGISLRQIER